MNRSITKALLEIEEKSLVAALCTVVKTSGSTPRHTTSKMLVYPDGNILGTVGGGGLENQVIKEALESIQLRKARLTEYKMVDPSRGDVGICGGQVMVYIEPILPAPLIIIIGGGHVGKEVAHLAKWLNFRVAVSDDRTEFCTPEANPDADQLILCEMKDLPEKITISDQTILVLTTRGVDVDSQGLPSLLKTSARYIGVIGSMRRWKETISRMQALGYSEQELEKIHSPIGLEIHAETPEEIAISIMAEIVMVLNGGSGKMMSKK